jgi:hypothetical protein
MVMKNGRLPKKCCLNCHFLEIWTPGPDAQGWHSFVSNEKRAKLAENPWIVFGEQSALQCFQGVWDSANLGEDKPDTRAMLTCDRNEVCFFYPYTPAMYFPVAKELERRAAGLREAEKDRALTRRAFRVAFAALIVSILATVATLAWNIWVHYHHG